VACKGFDEQVVRHDFGLRFLMNQFVCVRIVQANALDLSLFQFDYDLTFAAFLLNADKTIYGRFGSRSEREGDKDISIEGFRKALEAALELHQNYPANRASLAGKTGSAARYQVPEQYPALAVKYKPTLDFEGGVAKSCVHCHQITEAERKLQRDARKILPDVAVYPWPMPDALGLTLDVKEKAIVSAVAPGSSAGKDGFKPGDEILTLAGQPMISIADVQWVLHQASEPAQIKAEVLRDGQRRSLTLSLPVGWRKGVDISWRPTSWDLRRMAIGGLLVEELTEADRAKVKLPAASLALLVKHVGQYGDHAVAKRAGFQKNDIIVEFDSRGGRLTESQLLAYVLQNKMPGIQVPVTVLRSGQRVELKLAMQ